MKIQVNSEFTEVSITYTWECCICGYRESATFMGVESSNPTRFPENSPGWMKAAGLEPGLICPKHKVFMEVDGVRYCFVDGFAKLDTLMGV